MKRFITNMLIALAIIGGIGIIILVILTQMERIYNLNFNFQNYPIRTIYLFILPLFLFSGLLFVVSKLVAKKEWVKVIMVLFLGLIALFFASLNFILGGW